VAPLKTHRLFLGSMLCLGAVVSWGGMFPIMGSALRVMNPFQFTAIRYTCVALMFAGLLVLREGWGALHLESRAPILWVLGSLGFAGYGFLVFLGQRMAGPSGALCASVIMALMPMLSILANWLLRRVRPLPWSALFVLVSLCGVLTVVTKGQFRALIHLQDNVLADALILVGEACWMIYTNGASRFASWSPVRYTALTTALGVPTIWGVNIVLHALGMNDVVPLAGVLSILPHIAYMVVVTGFLGVLFWNAGNRIVTPIKGVLFMDVVPVTTFVILAVGGYRFHGAELVGVSMTVAALILNNVYQRMATARRAALSAPTVAGDIPPTPA
jgi:drug/metabolite transporter (DMT)-like permease